MTGLWDHKTKKTIFVLCVDNFSIKYNNENDLNHLLDALRVKYEISTDLTGNNYIGLTIKWEYDKGYVDISMPKYILKALYFFLHILLQIDEDMPHTNGPNQYTDKKYNMLSLLPLFRF